MDAMMWADRIEAGVDDLEWLAEVPAALAGDGDLSPAERDALGARAGLYLGEAEQRIADVQALLPDPEATWAAFGARPGGGDGAAAEA